MLIVRAVVKKCAREAKCNIGGIVRGAKALYHGAGGSHQTGVKCVRVSCVAGSQPNDRRRLVSANSQLCVSPRFCRSTLKCLAKFAHTGFLRGLTSRSTSTTITHHDLRPGQTIRWYGIQHRKSNGIQGAWNTDTRRVVSFATRGRAAALSSLPTPVRNHHHQYREIAHLRNAY